MKFIDRFVDGVISHYFLTIVIIFSFSGGMAYFYVQQQESNSIERFFFKDDPFLLQYQQIRDKIGSDELVMVALQKENLYTNENIQIIRDLTQALKQINGIMRVYSLTEIDELKIAGEEINVNKMIPEEKLSRAQLTEIQQKIEGMKGYNYLAASIGNSTMTIIIAELEQLSASEKTALCDDIIRITQEVAGNRAELHHTGMPIIVAEMDKMTKRDVLILTPIVGLIIFVITILLFKNITLSVTAMVTLALTQVWGVGLFVMCGEQFSFATSALSPLLVALAIADSVHLISHFLNSYDNHAHLEYEEKVARATKEVWMPCLFTTLTTSIGFLSFVTSTLQPLFVLGIFAATGVFFAFVIDVTYIPAALVMFRKIIDIENSVLSFLRIKNDKTSQHSFFSNAMVKIGRFSTTHVFGLVITFAVIIILSIIGMTMLKFETNPLKHLADSNKIKSDLLFVEGHFGGVVPSIMVIKSEKELDFTHPEALQRIDNIQKFMLEKYGKYIHNAYSVVDYLKEANKSFNHNDNRYYTIPENRMDILDYYEMNTHPEILKRMVSRDRREAYITCFAAASVGANEEWQDIMTSEEDKAFINEMLREDFSYSFTGLSELAGQMTEKLKRSQIQSIIIAFFLIFFMMVFVCKNVKLAIIGMIPNFFPIITTLGTMGWMNIHMNEATIMIAAVTLGIAIDDTIHFIVWYRRGVDSGMNTIDAIQNTIRGVGKPIVFTTITLSLGFLAMVFASFKPIQIYGALTAFTMITALIADFFLLPGLIIMFKPNVSTKCNPRNMTMHSSG